MITLSETLTPLKLTVKENNACVSSRPDDMQKIVSNNQLRYFAALQSKLDRSENYSRKHNLLFFSTETVGKDEMYEAREKLERKA